MLVLCDLKSRHWCSHLGLIGYRIFYLGSALFKSVFGSRKTDWTQANILRDWRDYLAERPPWIAVSRRIVFVHNIEFHRNSFSNLFYHVNRLFEIKLYWLYEPSNIAFMIYLCGGVVSHNCVGKWVSSTDIMFWV